MQHEETATMIREVIESLPKGSKAYLVGGAMRNAMLYRLKGEVMPQRDFDITFIGDRRKFLSNLRKRGFIYGKIRRKHQTVVHKRYVGKTQQNMMFPTFVVDISFIESMTEDKMNKQKANFTMNAFSIPMRKLTAKNWHTFVKALPTSRKDIKSKQLRINKPHPQTLFACVRFMSKGFKAPTKKEVDVLLHLFAKFPKYKFDRNVKKVFTYVGGKRKARALVKELGIREDIFAWETVLLLRKKYSNKSY